MRRLILILILVAGTLAAQTHNNTLTWTWPWVTGQGDNATGFHVWRATTCAALSPLPTTPYATVSSVTTLTYTDTAVAGGNTFCYAVTGFNTGGDGPAGISTLATTPFSKPTVSPSVLVTSQ